MKWELTRNRRLFFFITHWTAYHDILLKEKNMNTYFVYLVFALLIGFVLGMMLCRHVGDVNHSIGELIIGEPDDPDWPYLSLSLDEEVVEFEGEEYVVLKVNKLDLARKNRGA